jgi:hypothetical protein
MIQSADVLLDDGVQLENGVPRRGLGVGGTDFRTYFAP